MDGLWKEVEFWDLVEGDVEFYDKDHNYLGSKDLNSIIESLIEVEQLNDEAEKDGR